jgi:anti-sigma regulatory factor (Ser/Thr protein kinase)
LKPGSTLVLYTDGLVELRGEPLDLGLDRLCRATVDAPTDVDALCEAILAGTLTDPDVDDDVTLLVLTAAGDRARPLAAGLSREVELPGGRRAGAIARRALEEALADVASRTELDDVRLVVAELVNNAVVHGGADTEDTRVLMHVAATPALLRVEISNPGAPFEVHSPTAADEPGGFGLLIVEHLATRWGVDGHGQARVWFEIERTPED